MNRPCRSRTETGVVTRLVSTWTISSSAALSAAFAAASAGFCAARSAGVGGGIAGAPVEGLVVCFDGVAFFCGEVRLERTWPTVERTKMEMITRQTADLNIATILLGAKGISRLWRYRAADPEGPGAGGAGREGIAPETGDLAVSSFFNTAGELIGGHYLKLPPENPS